MDFIKTIQIITSHKENKSHQITIEYKEIKSNKEENIINIKKKYIHLINFYIFSLLNGHTSKRL